MKEFMKLTELMKLLKFVYDRYQRIRVYKFPDNNTGLEMKVNFEWKIIYFQAKAIRRG